LKHRKSKYPNGIRGIVLPSLSLYKQQENWDKNLIPTKEKRKGILNLSLRYQSESSNYGECVLNEFGGFPLIQDNPNALSFEEINRLVEIASLMGAIGEDLGLAYTAEQDIQRLISTSDKKYIEENTLLIRGLCEAGSLYLYGASHRLANLVWRLGLIDLGARGYLKNIRNKSSQFEPGTDGRYDWVSFDDKTYDDLLASNQFRVNKDFKKVLNLYKKILKSSEFSSFERNGLLILRVCPIAIG
jgi:hypothetical protein